MATKSIEEIIKKVKEQVLERSSNYLKKISNDEEVDAEEIKELKKLKAELKFVEKLNAEMNGKKPVDNKKVSNDEILQRVKDLQSSVSSIVCTMPNK